LKTVEKCRYADDYKATREPKCQCFVCQTKWRLAKLEKENEELKQALKESIRSSNYAGQCVSGALYVANLSR
jgi:hypothetical protein